MGQRGGNRVGQGRGPRKAEDRCMAVSGRWKGARRGRVRRENAGKPVGARRGLDEVGGEEVAAGTMCSLWQRSVVGCLRRAELPGTSGAHGARRCPCRAYWSRRTLWRTCASVMPRYERRRGTPMRNELRKQYHTNFRSLLLRNCSSHGPTDHVAQPLQCCWLPEPRMPSQDRAHHSTSTPLHSLCCCYSRSCIATHRACGRGL